MHITMSQPQLLNDMKAATERDMTGRPGLVHRLIQGLLRHKQTQKALRPISMRHVPEHIWRRHSALLMSRLDD